MIGVGEGTNPKERHVTNVYPSKAVLEVYYNLIFLGGDSGGRRVLSGPACPGRGLGSQT